MDPRARRGIVAGIALLLAVLVVVLIGARDRSGPEATGPRVFAAASLAEAFQEIAPDATFSFAGSDRLAFQVEQGAPVDVFASASPEYTRSLHRRGLVQAPAVFATNRLVVIVPRANPARIATVDDLADPGVRLVLGDRQVPIGAYARAALASLGLDRARANVVSDEQDVKAIVVKVALGEADAGIVYATDVRPVADRVTTVPIAAAAQPRVEYTVAVVRGAAHEAEARNFVRRLLGDAGQAALARLGFGPPGGA